MWTKRATKLFVDIGYLLVCLESVPDHPPTDPSLLNEIWNKAFMSSSVLFIYLFIFFVLFSFFILCFLGCISLFFIRDFGCIIACAPPNDNACWNFDIKARNALHWLRHGLLEKWWICGLNFFSFGSRWHSITGAYFMNLGQSCEECVETEQVTRWHVEVLWREYPIACEPRLKWSCQSDLRYAASSILENW